MIRFKRMLKCLGYKISICKEHFLNHYLRVDLPYLDYETDDAT